MLTGDMYQLHCTMLIMLTALKVPLLNNLLRKCTVTENLKETNHDICCGAQSIGTPLPCPSLTFVARARVCVRDKSEM